MTFLFQWWGTLFTAVIDIGIAVVRRGPARQTPIICAHNHASNASKPAIVCPSLCTFSQASLESRTRCTPVRLRQNPYWSSPQRRNT